MVDQESSSRSTEGFGSHETVAGGGLIHGAVGITSESGDANDIANTTSRFSIVQMSSQSNPIQGRKI